MHQAAAANQLPMWCIPDGLQAHLGSCQLTRVLTDDLQLFLSALPGLHCIRRLLHGSLQLAVCPHCGPWNAHLTDDWPPTAAAFDANLKLRCASQAAELNGADLSCALLCRCL